MSNEDIGEPGCKNWHVVPRLGIVGMLAGWWHVKISSGCPLATSQPWWSLMGRRSRARRAAPPAPDATPPRPRPPAAPRALTDERPQAPWHPFPLVELCVLVGIVLIVIGVITGLDSDRGRLALLCGLVLASLGGLETVMREHFSGFRSHSSVLAGLPAVLTAGALYFARAPWIAVAGGAAVVFLAAFWAFRTAFRRRSGGLSFR